tara:strand:- start:836 stop:1456 length:621 start_codon:yes stop_codon:yes gene_type:complete
MFYFRGSDRSPSQEEKQRRKEMDETSFPEDFDAELLQTYRDKYMTWVLRVDFELVSEPDKLEDWDFNPRGAFTRYSGRVHTLVGHYEVDVRKDIGFVEGYTHYDFIHFPEVECVLQLQLKEDKGRENNYGLVERVVTIPEQTLYYDNLRAGKWRDGEVQPEQLIIKLDLDTKKYKFQTDGKFIGSDVAFWRGWNDLRRDDEPEDYN